MKLRKKADYFILIDDVLFLKVENGLHKKVFYPNQMEIMRQKSKNFLEKNTKVKIGCMHCVKIIFSQFQELLCEM
jgi:hypothetical protein